MIRFFIISKTLPDMSTLLPFFSVDYLFLYVTSPTIVFSLYRFSTFIWWKSTSKVRAYSHGFVSNSLCIATVIRSFSHFLLLFIFFEINRITLTSDKVSNNNFCIFYIYDIVNVKNYKKKLTKYQIFELIWMFLKIIEVFKRSITRSFYF